MSKRFVTLEDLDLAAGKKARLYRLLYKYGPGNGRLMILPIDQGLEHGPRDFFPNPESKDPDFELRLALEGNFSAIACKLIPQEQSKDLRWLTRINPFLTQRSQSTQRPSPQMTLTSGGTSPRTPAASFRHPRKHGQSWRTPSRQGLS